ncbi:hypothetical protein EON63_09205 [archaeon]|nr:MAG: hypothetical protein EON63_09205 [archaeon]
MQAILVELRAESHQQATQILLLQDDLTLFESEALVAKQALQDVYDEYYVCMYSYEHSVFVEYYTHKYPVMATGSIQQQIVVYEN